MILKKIKIFGRDEVYKRIKLNYNECTNLCKNCFYADTNMGLCTLKSSRKRKCRTASLTTKPTLDGFYYTYRST